MLKPRTDIPFLLVTWRILLVTGHGKEFSAGHPITVYVGEIVDPESPDNKLWMKKSSDGE